ITDQPTSEASVRRIISASGFGNARLADSARARFISSYASRSDEVSATGMSEAARLSCIVNDTVPHPVPAIRSGSCFTPSPLLILPHHFTSCLYRQDLAALSLKPNFAVSSSSSCSFSR
ncbi:hypothetical protein PHYSODRAFT_517571, partial [Phytophthora sojae]